MAYAALLSVSQTLSQMNLKIFPLTLKERDSFQATVAYLIAFLDDCPPICTQMVNNLITQIRDSAYEAEYILESSSDREFAQRVVKVMNEIKLIEKNVKKIHQDGNEVREQKISSLASSSRPALRDYEPKMVALDNGLENKLLEQLVGGRSKLDVIPIVGMGGIGKTTLARILCNSQLIKESFEIRGWVTISQTYIAHEIVLGILQDIGVPSDRKKDGEQHLYQSLWGRKYLIVLDDVWDTQAWDDIKRLFPDNKNSSRIILTTRQTKVAAYANSFGAYHQMQCLTIDLSWSLLCREIFMQRDCPSELVEIGMEIAKQCHGLPLAISAIGGHLKKAMLTKEYWKYVSENVSSVLKTSNDPCLEILTLSYNYLPHHLKACFVYFGSFHEDDVINVSEIVKLLVAEGFIKPSISNSMEEVADENLGEVTERIDRSILAVELIEARISRNVSEEFNRAYLRKVAERRDRSRWIILEEDSTKEVMEEHLREVMNEYKPELARFIKPSIAYMEEVMEEHLRDDMEEHLREVMKDKTERNLVAGFIVASISRIVMEEFNIAYWRKVTERIDRSRWIILEEDGTKEVMEEYVRELMRFITTSIPDMEDVADEYLREVMKEYKTERNLVTVKASISNRMEEVAEEYLGELIERNLVLVYKYDSFGKPKRCGIHDLFRDICIREAKKEKLRCIWNEDVSVDSLNMNIQRNLILSRKILEDNKSLCSSTRLPRVLNIRMKLIKFPVEIFDQVCLTYLHLSHVPELPSSISMLRNLQTLIVSNMGTKFLPSVIWKMPQLRHLLISGFYLPDIRDIETNVCFLNNLQTLSKIFDFSCTPEVIRRISNLRKLNLEYNKSFHSLWGLNALRNLESLRCDFQFWPDSSHFGNFYFPISLKKLVLIGTQIPWEQMTIIGILPNLEVLKLGVGAMKGKLWKTNDGEFKQLKFLLIRYSDLVEWETAKDHFPRLRHLILQLCSDLQEIPREIADIPTLERIQLEKCSREVSSSAKEMLGEDNDIKLVISDYECHDLKDATTSSNDLDTWLSKILASDAATSSTNSDTNC